MSALDFAAYVRGIMDDRGWDGKTLAKKLGVHPSYPSQWINNGRIPKDQRIIEALNALKPIDPAQAVVARELRNLRDRLGRRDIDIDKYVSMK